MTRLLRIMPPRVSLGVFHALIISSVSILLFYLPHEQAVSIWSEASEDSRYLALLIIVVVVFSLAIKLAFSQTKGQLPSLGVVLCLCALDYLILRRMGVSQLLSTAVISMIALTLRLGFVGSFEPVISKLTYLLETLVAISCLTFVALGVVIYMNPVEVTRGMGAPMLLVVFWGTSVMLVLFMSARPRVGVGILVLFAMSSLFHNLQHTRAAIPLEQPITKNVTVGDAFAEWLRTRPDLRNYQAADQPYPVFFVTSAGGGGYAMAHAFTMLSSLTSRCPAFPTHLFALVGVSGGSVGNALYHANIERLLGGEETLVPCDNGQVLDLAPLEIDHLSPVLGVMLFLELPRQLLFLPSGQLDRSAALGESFSVGADGWKGIQKEGIWQSFLNDIETIDDGGSLLKGPPALVPVATNVATGDKFEFMPFNRESLFGQFTDRGETIPQAFSASDTSLDIRIVDAVVASASFPWVTPTIAFNMGSVEDLDVEDRRVLADGGYFENSGASTTSELQKVILFETGVEYTDSCEDTDEPKPLYERDLEYVETEVEHEGWNGCTIPFIFVNVVIDAHTPISDNDVKQSFLTDPINVLLKTRQARGARASIDFRIEHCGMFSCTTGHIHPLEVGWFESLISPGDLGLPLGWKMPSSGLEKLQSEVNLLANDCKDVEELYGRCTDYRLFSFFFDPL